MYSENLESADMERTKLDEYRQEIGEKIENGSISG